MLLNAFPKSFDHMRDAIMFGRDRKITLSEVQAALRSKELQQGNSKLNEGHPESLSIKNFRNKKFKKKLFDIKSEGKEAKESRSCHWCKKPGHLK